MPLRRILIGVLVANSLVLGLSACGGDDKSTQVRPTSSTPTATPTPTPVDPTIAAKAKIIADYKNYIAIQSQGLVTNDPTYAYDKVLTGNALQALKSVASGNQMIGRKYSGSATYLKGAVAALNLKAKPATATVQACLLDALVIRDKKGKTLTDPPAKVSTNDKLVLVGTQWKITETTTLAETAAGCSK